MRALILLCLLTLSFSLEAWTLDDMMCVKGVRNVHLSPNGEEVLYEVTDLNIRWNKKVGSRLYLEGVFLVENGQSPQWSPDGSKIVYRTDAGLWIYDRKEHALVVEGDVTFFQWSPSGSAIAYLERETHEEAVIVVDGNLPKETLWIVEEGHKRQLTDGSFHIGSFMKGKLFDWSPDGKEIAFSWMPNSRLDRWWEGRIAKISVVTGAVTFLTPETAFGPHYSPDGKWIAFAKAGEPLRWGFESRVWVVPAEGGEIYPLDKTFNEEVMWVSQIIGWVDDKVLVKDVRGTTSEIVALPRDGGPLERVLSDRHIVTPVLNGTGTEIGFVSESFEEPPEGFQLSLETGEVKALTAVNGELPLEKIAKTEKIQWVNEDGLTIEGLLTYPFGYEGGRVPLLLQIHGGPAYFFHEEFLGNPRQYPLATFASEGYAILRINIRGSTGYGKEFRFANYLDWGGKDFQDLMDGVDHVIAMGVADPERLGVLGWSYGGYMTAWTITQTRRFKAASVGAGLINLTSMCGTTDIPSFLSDYFGGELWENSLLYLERSPLMHIEHATTPTLIQHGEKDRRVPVMQSYELYRALQRCGVPTEFIIYPEMPHDLADPNFIRDAAERNLDWFARWVKGTSYRRSLLEG